MQAKLTLLYISVPLILGGCAHSRWGGESSVHPAVSTAVQQSSFVQTVATAHSSLRVPEAIHRSDQTTHTRQDQSGATADESLDGSPLGAVAQPSELQRPSGSWTLQDLEQLALAANPTLRKAAEAVEVSRGVREQVGLYANPVIGYSGDEIGNDGAAGQQGGFIGQEIVTGGKLRLNRAAADQAVRQAEANFEAQHYRVLNAVRTRFYEVLSAQESLDLAKQLVEVAEQAANAARELFQAGQGTRPDLLQARIEASNSRIIEENAHNRYQAAWQQLANVLGRPELSPAPLDGDLRAAPPVLDREEIWQEVLSRSPELTAAQAEIRRAELALQRARVEPIPNLATQAGVASDRSTGFTIASAQVGIELPLFDRNQGNIRAAEANLGRARAELQRVELALRDRLAAAYERYANARQQVEKYRTEILPNSQESLDLITEGYRRGQFGFLQQLVAQRTYFQTNLSYVDSLTSLWRSTVEITGLLLADGLGETAPTLSPAKQPAPAPY